MGPSGCDRLGCTHPTAARTAEQPGFWKPIARQHSDLLREEALSNPSVLSRCCKAPELFLSFSLYRSMFVCGPSVGGVLKFILLIKTFIEHNHPTFFSHFVLFKLENVPAFDVTTQSLKFHWA